MNDRAPSLRARLGRLLTHSHARNAGVITLGTIAAQVLLLVTTPTLSRLFTPADFGMLGLLNTLGTIGAAAVTLSWQYLVLNLRNEGHSVSAYHLTLWTGLVCSAIFALGYAGFAHELPVFAFGLGAWADALVVFLAVLTTALIGVAGYPLARRDRFRAVGLLKFNMTALPALTQIGLGAAGIAGGLTIGRVIGQAGAWVVAERAIPDVYRLADALRPRWRRMAAIARRHRSAMLHTPRLILQRAMSAAPVLFLLWYYGPVVSGLYFFTERLIERPGFLLSDALSRLPHKVFAERVRERRRVKRQILLFVGAAGAVVLPFVTLLALFGPPLFGTLFGRNWANAAIYATPLALHAGVRLTLMPVQTMIAVFDLSRKALAMEMLFIARIAIFPVVAWQQGDALLAVWLYVCASVLYQIVSAGLAFSQTLRYEASLR